MWYTYILSLLFRYPEEQISEPIHLDIGQQYYLEAIHKAATGLDHLSVGVTLPTGANEWPIPRKYLRFRPKGRCADDIKVKLRCIRPIIVFQ